MLCEVCGVKLTQPADIQIGKHYEAVDCDSALRGNIRLARARLRVVISELSAIRADIDRDLLKYDHVLGEQMGEELRDDLDELLGKYAPALRAAAQTGSFR